METEPKASRSPACILNGKSAPLEAATSYIARISPEFGAKPRILVTRGADDILAMAALAGGHRPIVGGGGDGTVSAVAGKLVGTDTALGVLPMGTLNHFAKDVGIPLHLEAAVRNLFTGELIKVDAGEINGRVFVNNSGIGFYPHFLRQREEQERRGHVKRIAVLQAVRALLRRYFRLRMEVHMNREEAPERRTQSLCGGNNRYRTAGLEMGTRPRLDSGHLWICTGPTDRHRNAMHVALKILMNRESDLELSSFEAEEIWAEPGTAQVNVSADGEVALMDAPLHYRCRALALSVIAPRQRHIDNVSAKKSSST